MICRSFNCIFIHIPKAAGRSIEQYFINRLNLDRENASHRQQLLLTDNSDPARGTEKLSHLSAAELCNAIMSRNRILITSTSSALCEIRGHVWFLNTDTGIF